MDWKLAQYHNESIYERYLTPAAMSKFYKNRMKFLIIIALNILFNLINIFPLNSQNSRIINEQAAKFKEILEIANQNYIDSVDVKSITEKAFSTMLKELDPFSNYLCAEQYKNISEINKGKRVGFGLNVIQITDSIVIANVIKNSSADSNGASVGDKIIFIDDKKTTGMSVQEINNLMQGEKGTRAKLLLKKHKDDSIVELILTRDEHSIKSISSSFIIPKTDIAYIKVISFSNESAKEIKEELNQLTRAGAKKLLFDLRSNNGGYLEKVLELLEQFFQKGDLLVYTEARNQSYAMRRVVEKDGDFIDIPIIVLSDSHTASAAEIFSGAIQDNDRGLIVGEITFGKGHAQKMWEFKDGSAFALTVARYFTPSGRIVQKKSYNPKDLAIADPLGTNADNTKALEEIYKTIGEQKAFPVFKSKKGRTILGGGGIFPDIIIKSDTLTPLSQVLKSRAIFFEFALHYLKYNEIDIRQKYEDQFLNFTNAFYVDNQLLEKFVEFSKSKNVWNEQMFALDLEYIRNFIKAVISNIVWGDNGFYSAMMDKDQQAQKAISSFEKAKELMELK